MALSRNQRRLDELVLDCIQDHPEARIIPLAYDLSELKTSPDSLLQKIRGHISRIDILVNNAGFLVNKPFRDLTPGDVSASLSVNYEAPLFLIQTLMPLLKTSKHAHVVNIGTMGAVQGSSKFPGLSAYSSSKSGLAALTECLAEEYKETTVAFNYLALGAVQTEMLEEAFPGYEAPVSPEKMAEYIAGFAQTGHHYFNGKILPVALSTP
jgi:NAD(P)-dependent dehydrogenase (short-subunit alcohol dehydrogenase family)